MTVGNFVWEGVMKRKSIKIVSILLMVVLFSVSCSEEKVKPVIEEEITNEISTEKENQEDETSEIPVNKEPTENEVSLFNALIGGFFYTENLNNDYNITRDDALNIFNNQMIEVAEESTELYFSGISFYEDKILSFIDAVDNSRGDYDEDFQVVLDNMIMYNTIIDGLSLQINGYLENVENYNENDINEAYINGEIFEKTMSLYQITNEYILFLVDISEYLASDVVGDTNIEYANTIRQETHEIFSSYVLPEMAKVEIAYLTMSNMYAHIASGDYYYNKAIEAEVLDKINNLEITEDTKALKALFIKNQDYNPDYLIDLPSIQEELKLQREFFPWPFGSVSFASDLDGNAKAIAVLQIIEILEFKVTSGEELNDDDISDAIMKTLIEQKIKKDTEVKNLTQENNAQVLDHIIKTHKENPLSAYNNGSLELEEINIDVKAIDNNVKALKNEIISKEMREKMIEKIRNAQGSDQAFLGSIFATLAPDLGGNTVYNNIISKFAEVLKENQGKMKSETYENLSQMLTSDLSDILGSKKSAFVTKFLNGSADDMVNKFSDWVNASQNNKNIKVNRNNLIEMLNVMGFETEAEVELEVAVVEEPETTDGNSRVYIPKATPESIIDLTGNDSLDSIMSKVFGKAVLDVPPREQYDNDDKITSRSYEVVQGDNEHITMVYANYKPDGSIAYASTSEIFNRPEGGMRYEVTISFDKDTKAIKEYSCQIFDKNAAGTIHGYWALYKDGVLVRKLHGDKGKIDETGYEYYDSGIKQKEYEYTYKEDAKLIQIKEYYEAGNMRSDIHYKMPIDGSYIPDSYHRDGSSLLYIPNGILGYEGQYLNGNRIGVHVSYDQETGAKDYETHYDNEGNKTKFIVFNNVSGEIESVEEFGQ